MQDLGANCTFKLYNYRISDIPSQEKNASNYQIPPVRFESRSPQKIKSATAFISTLLKQHG
ncbi:MAG: hypothetical protein KAU41_10380, partial [Deltaproteobacteria bacterium]|nr:hypothetical protein [Deltaproteobacteria bacterium]